MLVRSDRIVTEDGLRLCPDVQVRLILSGLQERDRIVFFFRVKARHPAGHELMIPKSTAFELMQFPHMPTAVLGPHEWRLNNLHDKSVQLVPDYTRYVARFMEVICRHTRWPLLIVSRCRSSSLACLHFQIVFGRKEQSVLTVETRTCPDDHSEVLKQLFYGFEETAPTQ